MKNFDIYYKRLLDITSNESLEECVKEFDSWWTDFIDNVGISVFEKNQSDKEIKEFYDTFNRTRKNLINKIEVGRRDNPYDKTFKELTEWKHKKCPRFSYQQMLAVFKSISLADYRDLKELLSDKSRNLDDFIYSINIDILLEAIATWIPPEFKKRVSLVSRPTENLRHLYNWEEIINILECTSYSLQIISDGDNEFSKSIDEIYKNHIIISTNYHSYNTTKYTNGIDSIQGSIVIPRFPVGIAMRLRDSYLSMIDNILKTILK